MRPCRARLMNRFALRSRKMANSKHPSNPPVQTANSPRVSPDGASGVISFGPYRLIATLRRLERAGQPVALGDREFDLLCTLIEHAGEVVSHQELMARTWGKPDAGKGMLRVHINALRKALSQDGIENHYIGKVARRGYVFTAPISRNTADDGEGSPLWEGQIIDAPIPPV
jgi:DNA-binding winged helix-turn-helix (wHTH) protein